MTTLILVDDREKAPLDLTPYLPRDGSMRIARWRLPTGDYSSADGSRVVERKKVRELLYTCGRGRARFERELERMRILIANAGAASIVIEGTPELLRSLVATQGLGVGRSGTRMTARRIIAETARWTREYGVEVVWAASLEEAAMVTWERLVTA